MVPGTILVIAIASVILAWVCGREYGRQEIQIEYSYKERQQEPPAKPDAPPPTPVEHSRLPQHSSSWN